MTRDEHRNACIEPMARAAYQAMILRMVYRHGANLNLLLFDDQPNALKKDWIASLASALDAIPSAGTDVHPIEATEEMIAAYGATEYQSPAAIKWRAMSAAGRLTNPPEKKP
jgi:hypothetical protein